MTESQPCAGYQNRRGQGTLTLRGEIRITEAAAFHEAARLAYNDTKAKTTQINFADVESLDFSAMQILWAVHKDFAQAERTLRLEGASPALKQIFAQLGLPLWSEQCV